MCRVLYNAPRQPNCHRARHGLGFNRQRSTKHKRVSPIKPLGRESRFTQIRQERDNWATKTKKMTLFELCVGVGIISAAVIFTAPSLVRARENYELDAVARQVSTKLQWTRIKAITGNRDCRVRVNSETSYVVECQRARWQTEETITVPRGFQIKANATPEFHARGNVSPSGTLTVWNRRLKSKRIIVNITGRVRVE
jgi:hypothetical protein